ncbi:ATP/GTP-binding protein [Streptomyces sp. LHD-70]|uniref:ATP/GTP-binding protein n=1 Tax=Streptomyces sp. LHD-70 TaxID=3072140 RepID=UPI00280D5ECD|nr:ATP/GTP-binding protein [Streptomyces sp. LHD-70]MDQ8707513.1 ATP/GTP-binding protein [Streptomyces sp. LHD-70]
MAAAFMLALPTSVSAADEPKPSGSAGGCEVVRFCVGASVGGSKPSGSGAKPAKKGKGKSGPTIPCSVVKMDPPPAAGSSLWQGHKPGDGAIYTRVCPQQIGGSAVGGAAGGLPQTFWAANPPAAVDPAQLAQEAVDKMTLLGPDIAINPKPGGRGLVGMPVWMAADQSQNTWGPNSASASAGGLTATATAKVTQVVWDMGDGTKVTCQGPGTPYKKSYGLKTSPDCGHVYTQPSTDEPGGKYPVNATATWSIEWQVAGGGEESGQLTELRTSNVAVTIVESQAVNS